MNKAIKGQKILKALYKSKYKATYQIGSLKKLTVDFDFVFGGV